MWQNRSRPKGGVKSSRSNKITKLDNIFSKYIRLRDCGFNYGRCISCDSLIKFSDCDCGHYINRKHMSTRYDEYNCNAQCRACNRFDEGNIQGYRVGLIKKFGLRVVESLEVKKFNTCHLSETELDILINHYSKLLEKLNTCSD